MRGWFNIETLREGAAIMSSGVNGIDMEIRDGRLVVTADTMFRTWEASTSITEREWQFLEISFHPKYGLSVYNNKVCLSVRHNTSFPLGLCLTFWYDLLQKKDSESVSYSDKTPFTGRYDSRFLIGGSNNVNQASVPIIVDDFEIWYGDREYAESLCLIDNCQKEHYVIGE